MPRIKTDRHRITQINLFSVRPENQQALIDLLTESARSVCHLPGWISASIHRGLDGSTVVNYAQSSDMKAQEQIVESLRQNGFLERNKLLGEAHPGLYEVVFTLKASQ